jgi:ATPase subunit of ABC transporter with duplicated ATPase domains
VDAKVSTLSGGERARLSLAKLVLSEPSWLALDEPTNHLDLAGRTALEEMLGEFPGALVFVSHDREFIDQLATRVIEVREGRVRSFPGNYSAYRAAIVAEEEARRPDARPSASDRPPRHAPPPRRRPRVEKATGERPTARRKAAQRPGSSRKSNRRS